MEMVRELAAIAAIKAAKARYFRGVDCGDGALVRSILAEECVLDYMGCCTDPATGRDFMPSMNIVVRGRSAWSDKGLSAFGIVSAHHGHDSDITFSSDTQANAIFAMTDRLFMPPGAPFAQMTGFGYYHETYEQEGGAWLLKTLRISRIRVEAF